MRRRRNWRRPAVIGVTVCLAIGGAAMVGTLGTQAGAAGPADSGALYSAVDNWIAPGKDGVFPAAAQFPDAYGTLGIVNTSGPVETKGHPFFTPLGTNGRACVTCHQPANGMSLSVESARKRWEASAGKDPLFAAIDGSNCPTQPQDKRESHSLLLDRGLFRVFLPWPPKAANGGAMKPEFTIEVVRDPTGCNTGAVYGLTSADPTISVYRRPRVVANLKYAVATGGAGMFIGKNGLTAALDPETGRSTSMNIMADAREPTLKTQAVSAVLTHQEGKAAPSAAQLQKIVDFEMGIFSGQEKNRWGEVLTDDKGYPDAVGPQNLAKGKTGVLGDNYRTPVFLFFDKWKQPDDAKLDEQTAFKASVARGSDIFFSRPFW
ncbi:MAG: hypothetical protein ABIO37_17135, partial [Caulobacteraceae bacterium]